MITTIAKNLQHRIFRSLVSRTLKILPGTAHTLKVLPIPKIRKWAIGGVVADGLRFTRKSLKVVQMTEGFNMELDLSESYERRMYYSRLYAPILASLFNHLLMPGDIVIDGGANIGYFSLLGAKCVGEHGSVYSFEPVLQTFEALNKNVQLNAYTNIHTNRLALTSSSGELNFEVPIDADTGNPLGRLATTALLGRGPQMVVPAKTLDEYADLLGITAIKLVKLDLEGSEVAAITGMQSLLSKHRISYLICELSTVLLDQMGIPYFAMQEALNEHGYSCYLIKSAGAWFGVEQIDLVAKSHEDGLPIHGDYLFVAPGMTIPENITS